MLLTEGHMGGGGGGEHRNTANKFNKHRITARKVHETPSPQQLFLAPYSHSASLQPGV